MKNDVCGRFAPSPSGRMHLGNVFCAMMAWLSCKAQGGKMVLRIEDLDPLRCKGEYVEQLLDDLAWLGLFWDEGGALGEFMQSNCGDYYARALAIIHERAEVYPCACTRLELHAANAPHLADRQVIYSGKCRHISERDREYLLQKHAALRAHVPDREVFFTDGLLGEQRENLQKECGDFILRRSDGVFAYQLAVVVDDARMGVNEVVRGRDLLASTARQLWLYELLGAKAPQFYHIPLLCAHDGRRLSKRERDLDMGRLRERYTAPRLLGKLAALAGIAPSGAAMSAVELAGIFKWENVVINDIVVDGKFGCNG